VSIEEEILDAIEILLNGKFKKQTTIENGLVKTVNTDGTCGIKIRGKIFNLQNYSGISIPINSVVKVFVPYGDMTLAFFIPKVAYSESVPSFSQVQVNYADTNPASISYIQNKPTIPSKTSQLENDSSYQTPAQTQALISAAITTKQDKEANKGLSANDYSDDEKQKLADTPENIIEKITDPDNYPLSGASNVALSPPLEVGGLSRTTGETQYNGETGYLRTVNFIPITAGEAITFTSSEPAASFCLLYYKANGDFLTGWADGANYRWLTTGAVFTPPSSAASFKMYTNMSSTATISLTVPGESICSTFKRIYLDNGYYVETSEIDPGLYQVLFQATDNEFNIVTIKPSSASPHESTLALMLSGANTTQFVDFSCMRYDETQRGSVEMVLQKRGANTPLPQYRVSFNDGAGAGRIQKLCIDPDAIPMRFQSGGIAVRRNNNYDNDWTTDDTVVVNLATMSDEIADLKSRIAALEQ